MKQIILITDGCSNSGSQPEAAAARARSEGVAVNVIGILDQGHLGNRGAQEVAEIAEAGGGMSRNVYARQLSQTMQMMTRQTVAHSIQQVVNKQLQDLFGKPMIEELPPEHRARVVQMMDNLQETSGLKVAVLVDTSLSMKDKLKDVEESIADLMLNLHSRKGRSEVCVFRFPGEVEHIHVQKLLDWTDDFRGVAHLFAGLKSRGVTPTGPALLEVLDYMLRRPPEAVYETSSEASDERGLWSEYVV